MKLLHDPKKPDAEHALKYWLDRSQCVSTDDPRLKEKIGAEILPRYYSAAECESAERDLIETAAEYPSINQLLRRVHRQ
jgi:hypothetical protein